MQASCIVWATSLTSIRSFNPCFCQRKEKKEELWSLMGGGGVNRVFVCRTSLAIPQVAKKHQRLPSPVAQNPLKVGFPFNESSLQLQIKHQNPMRSHAHGGLPYRRTRSIPPLKMKTKAHEMRPNKRREFHSYPHAMFMSLFKSLTMSCGTDIVLQNIHHVHNEME